MNDLKNSLIDLITETSTNLPPDVRAAMGLAIEDEAARNAGVAGAGDHRDQYRYGAAGRRVPFARTPACRRSWCTRRWA